MGLQTNTNQHHQYKKNIFCLAKGRFFCIYQAIMDGFVSCFLLDDTIVACFVYTSMFLPAMAFGTLSDVLWE